MNQFYYTPESRPLWVCPYCGRVETIPVPVSTYMPNLICGCQGYRDGVRHLAIMQGNKAAKAIEDAQDRHWRDKKESRIRAEEELRNWPPIATLYDWSLRRDQ